MKTLSQNNNFLSIEKEYSKFENSKIAILPIPFEATTSYGKGTERAPDEILKASAYVEFFDEDFNRELCFEYGIATIEPIDFTGLSIDESFDKIHQTCRTLIQSGKFVVGLGGEHSISLPLIKSHLEYFSNLTILQFDAHSDLRQEYEGTKYSHACVMARVSEIIDPKRIVQVGIRALCKEEYEFIQQNQINTFFANKIKTQVYGINWVENVVQKLGEEIYITFDVDFFDPAVIPSTGTPEPNGFFYPDVINILNEIKKQNKKIIGFDVVELSPIENLHHPNLTTARLVYKILNYAFY